MCVTRAGKLLEYVQPFSSRSCLVWKYDLTNASLEKIGMKAISVRLDSWKSCHLIRRGHNPSLMGKIKASSLSRWFCYLAVWDKLIWLLTPIVSVHFLWNGQPWMTPLNLFFWGYWCWMDSWFGMELRLWSLMMRASSMIAIQMISLAICSIDIYFARPDSSIHGVNLPWHIK